MVKDIYTGVNGSAIEDLTVFGDSVYFSAKDGANGTEIWYTDGTQAGTQLLKNIYPGSGSSYVNNFVVFQNKLFFLANDSSVLEKKLWYTDGTPQGTVKYKNQSTITAKDYLTEYKGRLYFSGSYGSEQELLYTDGINDIQYIDIYPFGSSGPQNLISAGNKLFFTASTVSGRELFVSDGTKTGTMMTLNLFNSDDALFNSMVVVDSVLYFTAYEYPSYTRIELYSASGKSGASPNPEYMLSGSPTGAPAYLTSFKGRLFFSVNDKVHGNEVWVGDSAKATLFTDLSPGTKSSGIASIAVLRDTVIFNASTPEFGDELWKSRGDAQSTRRVLDYTFNKENSNPRNLYRYGLNLFFTTNTLSGPGEYMMTDGTSKGTLYISGMPNPDAHVREHTVYNHKLYFVADESGTNTGTLYVYDSLSKSIPAVGVINTNGLGDNVKDLIVYKDKLFFSATDGNINGNELFYIDRLSATIKLFADIRPGANGSFPKSLEIMDTVLFFAANDGVKGAELWSTDGTPTNTKLVKDVYLGSTGSGIDNITMCNHRVYFSANTAFEGNELWRSDGTDSGTVMVKDINVGSASSSPRNFVAVNDLLFFTATISGEGEELWVTDGTTAGTKMVKNINPGAVGANILNMKAVKGNLYFSANDGVNGQELWRTDGTLASTKMQFDLMPGTASSNPALFTLVGDTLYFTAEHPEYGNEIWSVYTKCFYGTFSGRSTCMGDTIIFTDGTTSFGKTKTAFTWSFGNGDSSEQQNPKYVFDSAATYTVSFTVTNNEGCSEKMSQVFTITPFPTAGFTLQKDSLCLRGNSYTFNNSSTPVSGPFLWSFGDNKDSNCWIALP
jgi:ELWxxDGT repeat protein